MGGKRESKRQLMSNQCSTKKRRKIELIFCRLYTRQNLISRKKFCLMWLLVYMLESWCIWLKQIGIFDFSKGDITVATIGAGCYFIYVYWVWRNEARTWQEKKKWQLDLFEIKCIKCFWSLLLILLSIASHGSASSLQKLIAMLSSTCMMTLITY